MCLAALFAQRLLHTVNRNSNLICDHLVTPAAAALSWQVTGLTFNTVLMPQGCCGILSEAGYTGGCWMHCASNVHLHSVYILLGLQGTLAWQDHSDCCNVQAIHVIAKMEQQ